MAQIAYQTRQDIQYTLDNLALDFRQDAVKTVGNVLFFGGVGLGLGYYSPELATPVSQDNEAAGILALFASNAIGAPALIGVGLHMHNYQMISTGVGFYAGGAIRTVAGLIGLVNKIKN